jgi:hypothetical protein
MKEPKKYTIKDPYIRKAIDASTSHITMGDDKLFKWKDCPICTYPYEYGYRVCVSTDEDLTASLRQFGFSEAFINLYSIARNKSCDLILDGDGIVYSDLPTFEW